MVLFPLGLAGLVGLLAVACGGGDDDTPEQAGTPASEVTVNLTNWAMEPSSKTLAAGTVTFVATHEAEHGSMDMAGQEGATHQLIVARLPAGAKAGQSKFSDPVVNLTDIKPGEIKTAEARLEPGTYELACQVVEEVGGKSVNHYTKGMYTTVTVK
ncbi:MAG: hypothetical protein ACKVT1_03870 [Dehalococcoidia bacterium]